MQPKKTSIDFAGFRRLGYRVLVVWECQTTAARLEQLRARLRRFLSRA
jgi:G:T-mismatch repair DNA endonuclease (very short patch repair protein)